MNKAPKTPEEIEELKNRRKFYGRVKGKAFRKKQQERMDALLPRIQIQGVEQGAVDLPASFGNANPVWLEIGFGAGEHLAHQAAQNLDVNFVGSEPYLNGVAAALRHIEEGGLQNVRLHPSDVRDLFDALPDDSFERIYLLYPDPWPKARHAERRFMHPDNLRDMARLLKRGGELRVASDIPEYIEHGLEAAAGNADFGRIEHDIHTPWEGWFRTRYEAKAVREGRTPHYLRFERV